MAMAEAKNAAQHKGAISLPRGIQTYDSRSEGMARQLARDAKTGVFQRKKLGEQLIRESSEPFKRKGVKGG
jgi:hypothetical protein